MLRPLLHGLAAGCLIIVVQSCSRQTAEPAPPPSPPPPEPGVGSTCTELVITHARLYASPDADVLEDATVRIRDGRFAEVTARSTGAESPQPNGCTLDARGHVATAAYWNAHVHHMDPAFESDDKAALLFSEMFWSRGFTSVVDTGANPVVLSRLRRGIAAGRLVGPRIVVFGGGFVYRDGTPSYLPKGMLPELDQPAKAAPAVNALVDGGADGIKIFSGAFQTPTQSIYLPPDIIAAITQAAHARGVQVATHPTDRQSLLGAIDNGVDVVAHTVPPAGVLEPELLQRMRARNIALIPTLKLWTWELTRNNVSKSVVDAYVEMGVRQLHDYHAIGGEILFGTDVGYMTDYDTTEELRAMARAGLDFRAILASLTTAPGKRFAGTPATVSAGNAGDLVILEGDPAQDAAAFARPLVTIRGGQVVYKRAE